MVFHSMGPEYLPFADSLHGIFGFLNKNPQLLNASPALQEQGVRGLAVLDDAPLSDVVREYVADSLEAAFQHEQQLDALRMQISHLEGQRWMAHGHRIGRPSHRSRR